MLRFSKWRFIVILQFFLLIIRAVWNIKQTIMKDYNIQFCQWMACDRFETRWVQPRILLLIINFFSLNFTSIKIEGERGSSSQNERTIGGRGAQKRTKMNKRGRGGGQNSGILSDLSERTFWMSLMHLLFKVLNDLFCAVVFQIMLHQITDQILFLTIAEIWLLVDLQNGIWIYLSLHGAEDFLREKM